MSYIFWERRGDMQFYLAFVMSDFVNIIIILFRIWIELANNN